MGQLSAQTLLFFLRCC